MHTPDVLLQGLPNGSDMSASYTVGGFNGSVATWLICEVAMADEFYALGRRESVSSALRLTDSVEQS